MRVLLLCDGGGQLGVGHVTRSLALGEAAVAAGHEVVVVGRFAGSFLQRQLAAAPVEVVRLGASDAEVEPQPLTADVQQPIDQQLIDLVGRLRPDVLHVDSYDASGWLTALRASAAGDVAVGPMVFSNLEDGTFGRRPADVVVDPTLGAELSARPDDGSTWLLRGARYTPVRRQVIDARRDGDAGDLGGDLRTADDQVARSVLVVMGGTDPVGLTPAAVALLARTGLPVEVTAIAVGENAERVHAAASGTGLSLNVVAPVDDLAAMMARQDLVISAAGTSVWELCCIGVPAAVVWAVDNQRAGYDRVVAAGAAVGLGGPELTGDGPGMAGPRLVGDEQAVGLLRTALTDSRVRADLVLAAGKLVDGLGAWRVVRTWEQAARQPQRRGPSGGPQLPGPATAAAGLVARPAGLPDARLLWEWRNDAGTRAGSRNTGLVPWPDHLVWLESSLTRPDRLLLVVEDAAGAVGTIRWDLEGGGEWQVSVTVAPDRRGQSLARPLLRAGEVALADGARSSGADVTAYLAGVHLENAASLRLFETSGYLPDLPPDQAGFMRFRKTARGTLTST